MIAIGLRPPGRLPAEHRVVTDDRDKIVSIDQLGVGTGRACGQVRRRARERPLSRAPASPPGRGARVVNDTTQGSTPIPDPEGQIALQQSGKVVFASTDARSGEVADYRDFKEGEDRPVFPTTSSTGRSWRSPSAKVRAASSFVFQLNLVDTRGHRAWAARPGHQEGHRNAPNSGDDHGDSDQPRSR